MKEISAAGESVPLLRMKALDLPPSLCNLPPLYHNLPPNLREMAANQSLTPIAYSLFTLKKQSLHPYPPRFSPVTNNGSAVLPTLFPYIADNPRTLCRIHPCCHMAEKGSVGNPSVPWDSTSP
jgi:hypothetical protein